MTRSRTVAAIAVAGFSLAAGVALFIAALRYQGSSGRLWDRAAGAPQYQGGLHPERLVFTGAEFVMQARIGMFPQMWRSPDGLAWIEGERYSHGMNWDGRGGVEALTAFDGEPLVLQNQDTESGYSDTFEDAKFSVWPAGLAGSVSGEPLGGEMGVIVATTTDLWFTSDGHDWSSQRSFDVFGSGGDMIGAAVSNVTVLVAFSRRRWAYRAVVRRADRVTTHFGSSSLDYEQ